MWSLLAGGLEALGGLTNSAGGLLGSLLGYSSAQDANSNMRKMAAENRDWLNRMSNTAHQREVRDLRAAGLNPILSAGSLSGASTPSVSTDYAQQGYTPDFSAVGKGLKGVASAVSFYKGLKNQDANTELQQAQAEQANSATALNQAKIATEKHEAQIKKVESDLAFDKNNQSYEKLRADARKARAEADAEYFKTLYFLSPEGQSAYRLKNSMDVFKGLSPHLVGLASILHRQYRSEHPIRDILERYYPTRDNFVRARSNYD